MRIGVTKMSSSIAVRHAAAADSLVAAGFDLRRIGSHSLRSGGAVKLKLNGYDHDIMKKLGRWSSNTYLHYIQKELTTSEQWWANKFLVGANPEHYGSLQRRLKSYTMGQNQYSEDIGLGMRSAQ